MEFRDAVIMYATPLNVLAAVFSMYLIWCVQDVVQTRKMPPGPWFGWPIFGNAFLLKGDRLQQEMKLVKKYGPVFTLKVGPLRTVFATGEKAVREVLVTKSAVFSGRPKLPLVDRISFGGLGVVMADYGPSWRLHRKMFISALRDFMSDQKLLQQRIDEEKQIMKDYLLVNAGKPLDPDYILTLSIANVICRLTFGKHFDGTEPDYQETMKGVREVMTSDELFTTKENMIPWLNKIPVVKNMLLSSRGQPLNDMIRKYLKEHEQSYNPNNTRDFMDGFLKARDEAINEEKGNIQELLTDEHMILTVKNMFIAGFETTATTLRWAVLHLANNPDIQKVLQQELDNIVGKDRTPTLEDKQDLHLLQATIMEVQRLVNTLPEALPHKAVQDTTLCGFHIPHGTMVFANLYSVHMDETIYEEPLKFYPWRFIGSDGKVDTARSNFLPFSAGRRVCAGESLAKVELFLFLSDLIQNFFIKRVDEELISTASNYGLTNAPKGYRVIFEPRKMC